MYLRADIPHYHGKVVLVVDRSLLADSEFINRLYRLEDDLVGDGWRVLLHKVERGVETGAPDWSALNAPRVREVRALIKADYDADPENVKAVFLLGHVPIPYSGDSDKIVGGHDDYYGAHPADTFYGEMTALYGAGGWSDAIVNGRLHVKAQCVNTKYDGKLDQTFTPSTLELGVGRVDLYHMPAFDTNDLPLIKRYLDKNHDFRRCNPPFPVQRRAIQGVWNEYRFHLLDSFDEVFGAGNVKNYRDNSMHWFRYVSNDREYPDEQGDGQDFLLGYGAGFGGNPTCFGIGATAAWYEDACTHSLSNNFVDYDSQVVFVNLFGSGFGSWDQIDNFLRAPLANEYVSGSHNGYGLSTTWDNRALDSESLRARSLGAWLGSVYMVESEDFPYLVNFCLLGDPTLRMHVVRPASSLTAQMLAGNGVRLSWTESADATGYNIYRAPTRQGPFVLLNVVGPVTSCTYDAPAPESGDPPHNFFMVRAVKTEFIPNGTSYANMSEGVLTNNPAGITAFLLITNEPVGQKAVADTLDGTANSVALGVDAFGIDTSGSEVLAYQWFKNGEELTDGLHIEGATDRVLLIKAVEATDANGDNYKVRVSIPGLSPQTTAEAVVLVGPALPVPTDCLAATDEGISIDIDLSSHLNSPNPGANWQLSGFGLPALDSASIPAIERRGLPSKGSVLIVGPTTIRYTPYPGYFNSPGGTPDTFYYRISDGFGWVIGKVQVTVRDTSLAHHLQKYGLSGRAIGKYSGRQTTGSSRELPNRDWEISAKQCAAPGCGYQESLKLVGDFEMSANIVNLQGIDPTSGVILPASQRALAGLIIREITPPEVHLGISSCTADSGLFSFLLSGPAGTNCIIESTENLMTWSAAGTVTLNSIGEGSFSYSASSPHRFFRVYGMGNVHAPNAVGYVRLSLTSQSSLIADQLDAGDNRIGALLTTLPDGTQCRKWNGTAWNTATFSSGTWDQPDLTLKPGEGAFIDLPQGTAPTNIVFAGSVKEGNLNLTIPAGESFCSARVPCGGRLNDTLANPLMGTMQPRNGVLYQWTGESYAAHPCNSLGTFDPPVDLTVGESVKITCEKETSWAQSYSAWVSSRDLYDRYVAIGVGPSDGDYAFKYAAQTSTPLFTTTGEVPVTELPNSVAFPNAWVKLRRDGSLISIFVSSDGANWEKVNTIALWNLASEVEVGYYVSGTASLLTWRALFRPITLLDVHEQDGNVNFEATGPAGIDCTVEASSDLIQWSPIGSVMLDPIDRIGSFSDFSASPYQFFRAKYGSLCSANAVGYVRKSLSNDWTLISNPLNAPDNHVSALLSGLPNESMVLKWDADHTDWITNRFMGGQWEFPDWTLFPGEGAMIDLPAGCSLPWDITFVGEVMQGNLQISLPTKVILCSSMVPQAGPVDVLGLSLTRNDTLSKWLGTSYQTFTMRSWGWSPSTPAAAVGESIFVTKLEEPGTWSRSFNILQSLHLCSPSEQAGTFSFILKGPAGIDCTIEMSTDLVNWSSAGTVTLNAPDGTGDFSCASISPYQFFRASYGTLKSANAVGYVRSTLSTDWTLIANPLNAPDNRISAVLSGLPEGSKAMQWAPGGWQTATLTSGQWDYPDWTLNPGEGAMIDLPEGCSLPLDITFVGEVMQGDLQVDLPVGTSLCSSMVPQAGTVEALGLICTRTERVTKWDGTAYMLFSKTLTAWNPYTPSLVVGESAFVEKKAAEPWNRSFSVWP